MKNIRYVDIDGEEVVIKVSNNGKNFRVIKPWKNKDGSINWFNILTGGSWLKLIMVILMVIIIIGAIKEYVGNINILLDCFRVPGRLEVCKNLFTPENLSNIGRSYILP